MNLMNQFVEHSDVSFDMFFTAC